MKIASDRLIPLMEACGKAHAGQPSSVDTALRANATNTAGLYICYGLLRIAEAIEEYTLKSGARK